MAKANASVRIGATGAAEVKKAFQEVGEAGKQAFADVGEGARKAGEVSEREMARYRAQGERVRESLDPVYASQKRLNAELAQYERLAKVGAISSGELAQATERAKQRFDAASQAMAQGGRSVGQIRGEMLALQYTMSDIVSSLASGGSPLTILLQQGPQVTDAFGGVTRTLTRFGAAIATPMGAVSALAVAVAGLGAAWLAYDASSRNVENALQGIGRQAAITGDALEAMADQAGDRGGVSTRTARSLQADILRRTQGGLSPDLMSDLIAEGRNFAATLGLEVPEAVGQMADALKDPLKNMDALNASMNFLDGKTRSYIVSLIEANDKAEAQRVLLDAIRAATVDADEAAGGLGRTWNAIANWASDAAIHAGKMADTAIFGAPLGEQIKAIEGEIANRRLVPQFDPNERIGLGAPPAPTPTQGQSVETLKEELGLLRQIEYQRSRVAGERANEARTDAASIDADSIVREVMKIDASATVLIDKFNRLRNALDDQTTSGKMGFAGQAQDALEKLAAQIDKIRPGALNGLVEGFDKLVENGKKLEEFERQQRSAATAADSIREKTGQLGLQLAQVTEETKNVTVAERTRVQIMAEFKAAQELAIAGDKLSAEEKQNYISAARNLAVALFDLKSAEEANTEAQRKANQEAEEGLRIIERRKTALMDIMQRSREASSALALQQSLVYASDEERAVAEARFAKQREYEAAGVSIADPSVQAAIMAAGERARTQARLESRMEIVKGTEALTRANDIKREEINLLGQSERAQKIELAVAKARQELEKAGISPDSADGRARIEAAREQGRLEAEAAERSKAFSEYERKKAEAIRDTTRELERQADATRKLIDAQKTEAAELQASIDLVGKNAMDRARILGEIEAFGTLQKQGINPNSNFGKDFTFNAGQLAEEAQRLKFLEQFQDRRESLEVAIQELEISRLAGEEREKALTALRADVELRKLGVDLGSKEADQYRALAEAQRVVSAEVERQKEIQAEINGLGASAIDGIVEALGRGEDAFESLGDAGKRFLQELYTDFLRFSFANPLKNLLYGTDLPTMRDMGGLVGSLMGNKPRETQVVPDLPAMAPAQQRTLIAPPAPSQAPIVPPVFAPVARVSANDNGPLAPVIMANQGATRNQGVVPSLVRDGRAAVAAVYGADHTLQVYSGGQDHVGRRTGSVRHNNFGQGGRAMDAYILDPSGNRLRGDALNDLAQYWLAQRKGGVGLEMRGGGIHLDNWATPPPGGGMFWNYDTPSPARRRAYQDGMRGIMPELRGSRQGGLEPTSLDDAALINQQRAMDDMRRTTEQASVAVGDFRSNADLSANALSDFTKDARASSNQVFSSSRSAASDISKSGETLATTATDWAAKGQGIFGSLLGIGGQMIASSGGGSFISILLGSLVSSIGGAIMPQKGATQPQPTAEPISLLPAAPPPLPPPSPMRSIAPTPAIQATAALPPPSPFRGMASPSPLRSMSRPEPVQDAQVIDLNTRFKRAMAASPLSPENAGQIVPLPRRAEEVSASSAAALPVSIALTVNVTVQGGDKASGKKIGDDVANALMPKIDQRINAVLDQRRKRGVR